MLLIVEDDRTVARLLQRNLHKEYPELVFVIVKDAENAKAALEGRKYQEWNPATREMEKEFSEKEPSEIHAVIWDNCFPSSKEGSAESDMGLTLIGALKTSAKVNQHVFKHFISSSSDSDREKFEESGYFAKILPKNFNVKELRPLLLQWGLINGGSPYWTPNTRTRRLDDKDRSR